MQIIFSADLPEQAQAIMQSGGNFFGQTCWFELLNKHVFSLQSNRQSGYLVGMNEDGFAEIICPCQYVVKHRLLRSFNSLTCFYTPLFKLVTASNGVSNQQIIEFFFFFGATAAGLASFRHACHGERRCTINCRNLKCFWF